MDGMVVRVMVQCLVVAGLVLLEIFLHRLVLVELGVMEERR